MIKHVDAVLDLSEFEIGGQPNDNFGARYGSVWKHANFGVEVPIGWFYFRAGIHQGDYTAGIGVDARFIRIDLATYAEEDFLNPGMLTSRRVAASVAIGWGGATPAVESATGPLESPAGEKKMEVPPEPPASPPPTLPENPSEKPPEKAPEKVIESPKENAPVATPAPTEPPAAPTAPPATPEPTVAPTEAAPVTPTASPEPSERKPQSESGSPETSPREPETDRFNLQD
jgi:hypothetical protein